MNLSLSRLEPNAIITARVVDVPGLPIALAVGPDTTVYLSIEEAGAVVDELIAALAAAPS